MRNIVNISLPEEMTKIVKREIKSGGFATTSEFFRHLLRLWSTHKLAEELRERREDFKKGEGKILRSLKDLR